MVQGYNVTIHVETSKAASGPGQFCLGPAADPIELLSIGSTQSLHAPKCCAGFFLLNLARRETTSKMKMTMTMTKKTKTERTNIIS